MNISYQDMNDNVSLTLAKKINTDCDKTDQLRHYSRYRHDGRNCLLPRPDGEMRQTVVMVGAMRPSTSMSADSPHQPV